MAHTIQECADCDATWPAGSRQCHDCGGRNLHDFVDPYRETTAAVESSAHKQAMDEINALKTQIAGERADFSALVKNMQAETLAAIKAQGQLTAQPVPSGK